MPGRRVWFKQGVDRVGGWEGGGGTRAQLWESAGLEDRGPGSPEAWSWRSNAAQARLPGSVPHSPGPSHSGRLVRGSGFFSALGCSAYSGWQTW